MKNAYRTFRQYPCQFRKNQFEYLILLDGFDISSQFLVIPFLHWITTFVLQAGEIPPISYRNIVVILTRRPLIVVILLIELICLMVTTYGEFVFLLKDFCGIGLPEFSWRRMFRQTKETLSLLDFGSLILLLGYFLPIIPFADITFRTPLPAKIQVPQSIVDYLTHNAWLIDELILFYLLTTMIGVRLVLTIPLTIYQHLRLRAAIPQSWQMASKLRWLKFLVQIVLMTIIAGNIMAIFYPIIYTLQIVLDLLPGKLPLITAIFNLSILQLGGEILAVWAGTIILLVVINPLTSISELATAPEHPSRGLLTFFMLVFLTIGLATLANNIFYMMGAGTEHPIAIFHRGVTEKNRV